MPRAPIKVLPPQDLSSLNRLMLRFNMAASAMVVFPILTCAYVLTVRFFSIELLTGLNGLYILLALVIALLGVLAGYRLIRDIVRQLVQTNLQLQRLYNQQAAFVSNVAHEFRSPLMIFKGAMDNLADGLHGPLTADQSEPVSMCQREAKRLSRLIADLLDLARMEAGKLQLRQEEILLQDLVRSTAQLFSGPMKERGLQLVVDLPAEPAKVVGDRDRLHQVFVNLFSNAVKYTDTGEIRVRLVRNGDLIEVHLEDTGRGIAPDDLDRVFDKFERVGVQTEEGSGLGLPIARDIIQLHRGRLWAESQPGQGSQFVIQLPLKASPVNPGNLSLQQAGRG